MPKGRPRVPLETRFWRNVARGGSTECWLWTGCVDHSGSGYGKINEGGAYGRQLGAHSVSWQLHRGEIPHGQFVLHTCDTPRCVNPSHLFLGTHSDNMADRSSKGRQSRGERSGVSVLTRDSVLKIRILWETGGFLQREIAVFFGVYKSTVQNIIHRRNWGHV